jgi:hypothetical protein
MKRLLHGLLVVASCLPFLLVLPGVLEAHRAQERAERPAPTATRHVAGQRELLRLAPWPAPLSSHDLPR